MSWLTEVRTEIQTDNRLAGGGFSNTQSCPPRLWLRAAIGTEPQPLSPVSGPGVPLRPGLPQCTWGPAWSITLPHSFPSNASPSSGTCYGGASPGRDGEPESGSTASQTCSSRAGAGAAHLCVSSVPSSGPGRGQSQVSWGQSPGLTQACVPSISQHGVWPRKALGNSC